MYDWTFRSLSEQNQTFGLWDVEWFQLMWKMSGISILVVCGEILQMQGAKADYFVVGEQSHAVLYVYHLCPVVASYMQSCILLHFAPLLPVCL